MSYKSLSLCAALVMGVVAGTSAEAHDVTPYKIKRGDTLLEIIHEHYGPDVDDKKVMREIIASNPRAFPGGEAKRMLAGRTLELPDRYMNVGPYGRSNRRDEIYFFQ